ncbi:MAG: hypothetical protein QOI41_5943, partial [Myxococcales bacterium]|nr:hypothetical protein [Myxococcales bacterium]
MSSSESDSVPTGVVSAAPVVVALAPGSAAVVLSGGAVVGAPVDALLDALTAALDDVLASGAALAEGAPDVIAIADVAPEADAAAVVVFVSLGAASAATGAVVSLAGAPRNANATLPATTATAATGKNQPRFAGSASSCFRGGVDGITSFAAATSGFAGAFGGGALSFSFVFPGFGVIAVAAVVAAVAASTIGGSIDGGGGAGWSWREGGASVVRMRAFGGGSGGGGPLGA